MWSCGNSTIDANNKLVLTDPNIAYYTPPFGKPGPYYKCSSCIAAQDENSYIGLNPTNINQYGNHALGGVWTDFGGTCDSDLAKVCCCDGVSYTGNE